MHLSEFKAWFEGFTEEMKAPPSKDQWAKIKKRVKEISADYTPAPVFIDHYWRPYRRYWDNIPYWASSTSGLSAGSVGGSTLLSSNAGQSAIGSSLSADDWRAAGKAEYSSNLR